MGYAAPRIVVDEGFGSDGRNEEISFADDDKIEAA